MYDVQLPYEASVAPVSLAIGEAGSLPTVPNGTGSEHGIAVLMDNGMIRMFGQTGSALPAASRPWKTGYEYTGSIAPPALPSGVTIRHYCDIEVLPDGDIVVTIAQNPLVSVPNFGNAYREGWIRYDHATSSWEAPVTSHSNYEFFHDSKDSFVRSTCMSLDTNYWNGYHLVVASGLSTASGNLFRRDLWKFNLNSSGIFSFVWRRSVPTPFGYGYLQGVAAIDSNHVVVTQDYGPGPDYVRLFDVSSSPITLIAEAQSGPGFRDLANAVVMPGGSDSACDYWHVLTTREGQNQNDPLGHECADFYSLQVSACDG